MKRRTFVRGSLAGLLLGATGAFGNPRIPTVELYQDPG